MQDGTTLELKPLPLKRLRKVMAEWNKMQGDLEPTEEDDDPSMTIMSNVGRLCLENNKKANHLTKSADDFDDVVDTQSLFRIIKVCAGIDLESVPKALTETSTT